MNREEFWEWMNTCPTHKWDVLQSEGNYCGILFPLEDEEEYADDDEI